MSNRPPKYTRRTRADVAALFAEIPANEMGCKLWPHRVTSRGYGLIYVEGQSHRAHRLALELKLGRPIAPGLVACHTCDVPGCVSAEHLWEGTTAENNLDMTRKGRMRNGTHRRGSVGLDRAKRKWRVRLQVNGEQMWLGHYATRDEAEAALALRLIEMGIAA